MHCLLRAAARSIAPSKPSLALRMHWSGPCWPASIFESCVKITVSHSFQAAIFGRSPMFSGFHSSNTASVVRMFGIFDGGFRRRLDLGQLVDRRARRRPAADLALEVRELRLRRRRPVDEQPRRLLLVLRRRAVDADPGPAVHAGAALRALAAAARSRPCPRAWTSRSRPRTHATRPPSPSGRPGTPRPARSSPSSATRVRDRQQLAVHVRRRDRLGGVQPRLARVVGAEAPDVRARRRSSRRRRPRARSRSRSSASRAAWPGGPEP